MVGRLTISVVFTSPAPYSPSRMTLAAATVAKNGRAEPGRPGRRRRSRAMAAAPDR